MHTFALNVVRERYVRLGTENLGSLKFELHEDRVYDANIASVAMTLVRRRFGGGPRRNDRDRDGGGGNRNNFKNARLERETAAPRTAFAKDYGKGTSKAEAPTADKAE
eukprot:jgi/Tetstr1/425784/TSEL_001567.t1